MGVSGMGVQHQLGFQARRPNGLQRAMQHVASNRASSWLLQRTLYLVDRPLHRWTRGRFTLPGLLAGLPVVLLTTTGRRTGRPRVTPLVAIPLGDDLVMLGTNYGQERTPSWVLNLEANPAAMVTWRDEAVSVRARHASEDELDLVWHSAALTYVGFPKFRDRTRDRRSIRAFVLEPST